MDNSNSYFINSEKTIDDSKFNISKKSKFKKISLISPNNLYFQKNNSSSNIFLDNKPQTSLAKNYTKISNIYNKFTLSCLRKNKKYGNFFIFGKRDMAFNKNIKKGKKVFKYNQSLLEEKQKLNFKKNSLYLTENKTCKNKETKLPLLDKDKSTYEEKEKSRNYSLDLIYTGSNKNKKNNKDSILLKKIILNREREEDNIKKKEYFESKNINKKQSILKKSSSEIKSINNYIKVFKNILSDKYFLNIKNEKLKVINENKNNQIEKIKDDLNDLEADYKLFSDEFYPKLNEYLRFFELQRDIERQRNLGLANKVYLLQKRITNIKNKINKYKIEKEYLMKEMLLQICIREKKLNLQDYYKDIILYNYNFEEIKKKYGGSITKEEYNKISKYKNSFNINDFEIIFEKLKIYTNNDIKLLDSYNKSRKNNFLLEKYKKKVEEEINIGGLKEINDLIFEKEKILKNIIQKNIELEKNISILLKEESPTNPKKIKKGKLYLKVELLLKNLVENLNYELNIDNKIKGGITEEKLIIQMMKKIEIIITIFLEQYKNDKIIYPEKEKYFKNLFDKEKKNKKTIEQKRILFIKHENEKKKIFDKYNKILFKPHRKIYIKKLNKKIKVEKDLTNCNEKGEIIDEYLYDIYK